METSLTPPFRTTDPPASFLSDRVYETLTKAGLKPGARTQLLVLQILQLVEEYESSAQTAKDDNNSVYNWKMPSEQKDQTKSKDKSSGSVSRDSEDDILNRHKWRSYKLSALDEMSSFQIDIGKMKRNIKRMQSTHSYNSLYSSIEELMEKDRVFVTQMENNLLALEEHEQKFEEYVKELQKDQTTLLNEISSQKETINSLEDQVQACTVYLKLDERKVKDMESKLAQMVLEKEQLQYCTRSSNKLTSELEMKTREVQEINAKLQLKQEELVNVSATLTSTLLKNREKECSKESLTSILEEKKFLESQLQNCSISSSLLQLQLQVKLNEVKEWERKANENVISPNKLQNCYNEKSTLLSELRKNNITIQQQDLELQYKERRLQACLSKPLDTCDNKTRDDQKLSVAMENIMQLQTQLNNCTVHSFILSAELERIKNENRSLSAYVTEIENLNTRLKSCNLLLSTAQNKTEILQEELFQLKNKSGNILLLGNSSSMFVTVLLNETSDITFLVTELVGDSLGTRSWNNSIRTVELDVDFSNCTTDWKFHLQEPGILYDKMLVTPDGTPCLSSSSSVSSDLMNETSELPLMIYFLREREYLIAELIKCNYERRRQPTGSEDFINLWRDRNMFRDKFQSCSTNSSNLLSQLEKSTKELEETTKKLQNSEKQLQQCASNPSGGIGTQRIIEILRQNDVLESQLKNCSSDRMRCETNLRTANTQIQDLETKLENNRSVESLGNCLIYCQDIVSEVDNKTKMLEEKNLVLEDIENKFEQCSRNVSTLLTALDKRTDEIRDLTSQLASRNDSSQSQNCFGVIPLYLNCSQTVRSLETRVRELNHFETDLHNCTNISSSLQNEIDKRTDEIRDLTSQLSSRNNSTQNCFGVIPLYLNCSQTVRSLETDINNCKNISSVLQNEIDKKTDEIRDLTSQLSARNTSTQNCNGIISLYRNCSRRLSSVERRLESLDHFEADLQNCTNVSTILRNEIDILENVCRNGGDQNLQQCQANFVNCSNQVASLVLDQQHKSNTIENLTSQLDRNNALMSQFEKCSENATTLISELSEKSRLIENVTLQNKELEGRIGQCNMNLYNISTYFKDKISPLTGLVDQLVNRSVYLQDCPNIPIRMLDDFNNVLSQIRNLVSDLNNVTLISNIEKYLESTGNFEGCNDARLHERLRQFLTFLQSHTNDIPKWSSLPAAIDYGSPIVIQTWLDAGADPNFVYSDGYTALQRAARDGNLQLVQLLVQYGASLTTLLGNRYGDLPIHLATAYDHLDVVRWMLDYGVPVDIRNRLGATPLITAAASDRIDIATLLLNRGADVNAKTIHGDNRTALHEAAGRGTHDMVTLLLDHGADVNAVTSDEGQLPVHWAAKVCNYDTLRVLIQKGSNFSARDKAGTTVTDFITACRSR